jgi:hypothetical protein
MPTQGADDRRKQRVFQRVAVAIHEVLEAAEELKKANAALAREATRPAVRLSHADEEEEDGED